MDLLRYGNIDLFFEVNVFLKFLQSGYYKLVNKGGQ